MPSHQYPQHTLAPDPHQLELRLMPVQAQAPTVRPYAAPCPYCAGVHLTRQSYEDCRDNRN